MRTHLCVTAPDRNASGEGCVRHYQLEPLLDDEGALGPESEVDEDELATRLLPLDDGTPNGGSQWPPPMERSTSVLGASAVLVVSSRVACSGTQYQDAVAPTRTRAIEPTSTTPDWSAPAGTRKKSAVDTFTSRAR